MAKGTPGRPACSIDGCERPHYARSWCDMHYRRWRRFGDPLHMPERAVCSIEGCDKLAHGHGWCEAHWTRWRRLGHPLGKRPMSRPPQERFWYFVGPASADECWDWQGGINSTTGYGMFKADGTALPHRFAYELMVGPIPAGLTIDHLCRNRACVNPLHLEPVTERENILRGTSPAALNARKTHCKHGHAFTVANTYIVPAGTRACRACHCRIEKTARSQHKESSS